MCGILVTYKTSRETFSTAFETIKHRGTESNINYGFEFLMGHHRLPIQTTDNDEYSQPIYLAEGVFMLYNGEIFNYDEEEYENDVEYLSEFFSHYKPTKMKGDPFSARAYTEMQTWDGFWSIVIVDTLNQSAIAFTDPLGKKQLYIDALGNISSEIKALRMLSKSNWTIDWQHISTVRQFGYDMSNRTAYRHIKRLIPNNIYLIEYRAAGTPICVHSDYYPLTASSIYQSKTGSFDEHERKRLYRVIDESVRRRVQMTNYPSGLLLSGGLDSTIIATLAHKYNPNLKFYTIENDETVFAELVADHLGVELVKIPSYMDSNTDLFRGIYGDHNEGPIDLGSVIPQYFLFEKLSHDPSIRVVMSGDGADELFGGYRRAREYDSQLSDVFNELPYYHLPRLDKMSMAFTLELRNPFLGHDVVKYALSIPHDHRKCKQALKLAFMDHIPSEIIHRPKLPLKNPLIVEDKIKYRHMAIQYFLDYNYNMQP